jgi:hypothetical protein
MSHRLGASSTASMLADLDQAGGIATQSFQLADEYDLVRI